MTNSLIDSNYPLRRHNLSVVDFSELTDMISIRQPILISPQWYTFTQDNPIRGRPYAALRVKYRQRIPVWRALSSRPVVASSENVI
jgi:hypothetical protein